MVPTPFADVTLALCGFLRGGDVKDVIRPKNGGLCAVNTKISELLKFQTFSKRSGC